MLRISYAQMRAFLITSVTLLAAWLIMGHYARFEVLPGGTGGKVTVNVSFLAPMNRERAVERLAISSQIPGKKVVYSTRWISRNTMQVVIDESLYPRGLTYNISFKKAPALIPPFTVTVQKRVGLGLAPKVVALEPRSDIPTAGPLVMVFNTPVDPGSFARHVSTTAPGKFSPMPVSRGGEGTLYDYSRWVLSPAERFANRARYSITVTPGLKGTSGGLSAERAEFTFITAPALEITEIYPQPFSPSVWLSRNITVTASQPIKEAGIKVEGVKGTVTVKGNTVMFDPQDLFLPNSRYRVNLDLVSQCGEQLHKEFSFGTTNLGNQRWIGVRAGNPCSLQVYEGNRPLHSFQGWLSIPADKIPRVTMYETKRGTSREYRPDDSSPISYIRLNADIMIHQIIPGAAHDHGLAGLPPSYGCILLNKEDMDWLMHNVPEKCMVIVY